MSNKEKPLPKPPTTAFGGKKSFEQESDQASLMADRMAAAMAEGKLDEFLKQEMPDNEYARNLATMMMGMTGMLPAGGHTPSPPAQEKTEQPQSSEKETTEQIVEIPEDVRMAIQDGDMKGLADLLRREHQKRMPDAETKPAEEAAVQPASGQPVIDKDLIDAMIQIAADNSVTLDWIMLRAIKVYVEEYRKTGKL
jgi:hypothetical protein